MCLGRSGSYYIRVALTERKCVCVTHSKNSSFHHNLFLVFDALLVTTLLLTAAIATSAQGVGSSRGAPGGGGTHTIQGRVYSPSGRQVETQLRVRLESNETPPMSTVTDSDGAFVFSSLLAGEYRLTVEGGNQFEDAKEYPSIYREASSGGRIVTLAIQLRLKESADPAFVSVPKDALDHYKKGLESARAGDSKKAVDQLKNAVSIYPKFVPALNELGVQYLKLAQPEKAAEALEASLKITPDSFVPRLTYGIALLNQKKFAEAETQLSMALKKNDKSPTAHMYLGIALMSQQKLEDAEKELGLAVASNSSEVAMVHRYLGGIYWGKREYQRAADELETYLKLVPKAADADRTREAIKELRSKKG
jgi:Tfp pilus assembly protein PilF